MPHDMSPLRREIEPDPLDRLYSVEAEQSLLGCLLLENRAYEYVVDIVSRDDFVFALNGRLFTAIGAMIERGQTANPVTIEPLFREDTDLKESGGRRFLKGLVDRVALESKLKDTALESARLVADFAKRREIVLAARDIIADAAAVTIERDGSAILDDSEERLFQIGERRRNLSGGPSLVGESVASVINAVEAAYKVGTAQTLKTGLDDLDKIIGGMAPGELHVLAGRPAMGKSCCAGTIAYNLATAGKRVLYFSLEMTKAELTARWLASMTGISTERQREGSIDPADMDRLVTEGARLKKLLIHIDDQARLSVAQMRQRSRRLRRRHGLDLIIVDHLQLIRLQTKVENRRVEVGEASGQLKALAKELNVPILLVSQLNRAVENREDKRPMLSDLRESGDVEQDADVVSCLYREEYYLIRAEPRMRPDESEEKFLDRLKRWADRCDDSRGKAEVIVAKNRHGRTGVVSVYFDASRQRFENLLRENPQ